mmetsp:Transcript_20951/g.23318  ORF Transcript_20951/g.23318 Transcript_20951/m.23318 type:complete len:229 (+) Transcript_20951:497-1183(+)
MYNIKEFYMGEYYLPVINPVSEGSLIEFGFNIYCSTCSWEELQQPVFFGMNRGQAYAACFVIFQIYQNIEMFLEIINAKKYERKMVKRTFYMQFSSYYLIVGLCFLATLVSPNNVLYDPSEGGRSLIYIVIFTSSYLVLHLIFGHLCDKEFLPYSTPPFLITLFTFVTAILGCVIIPEVIAPYEYYIWYTIAVYMLINSLISFNFIIKQMEEHFNIKAFDITDKVKDR